MEEKKSITISLGTVICIFIIILLVVTLVIVYYLGFVKNNEEISNIKAQKATLEAKIAELENETNKISEDQISTNNKSNEILREDLNYDAGYSFNTTLENLTKELMKKIKDSDLSNTIEVRQMYGAVHYTSIGWFEDPNSYDVIGISIYYGDDNYVSKISCSPAKYGSGDTSAIIIPENLYETAKKILGSETEEWKKLEQEGKIVEKTYDAFSGKEITSENFYTGM